MTNETIGHYASHPGGGYQPPKSDKPKTQNPPTGSGMPINPDPEILKELTDMLRSKKDSEFYTITHATPVTVPSELELRIRNEVMDAVDELHNELHAPLSLNDNPFLIRLTNHAHTIKDRLNLLWCE